MKNIRQLSLLELEEVIKDLGEPKFRAKQVYEWIWKKFVGDIEEMTNLSKSLREKLAPTRSVCVMLLRSIRCDPCRAIACAIS